jgi:AcrR family transcriptional regulator
MAAPAPPPSPRKTDLLERSYRYVLDHGLADTSLRPLAAAIGSSPRVLLYLFGSKDELVRALLARARSDELAALATLRPAPDVGLQAAVRITWRWLAAPRRRPLLTLWLEAYARSLVEPEGAWSGFADQTVRDWLSVLATAQSPARRRSERGRADRTLALSVLRGALLDLLASGDADRTGAAVEVYAASLEGR